MRVVTFGEAMMRLSPPDSGTITDTRSFEACLGGSEFNVAAGLCSLGHNALFVTRLPDNQLGRWAQSRVRSYGVELDSGTLVPGGRLGTYYLEKGASPRPNRVIYDRLESCFASTPQDSYDWDSLLADADWFHVSGITPALGAGPFDAVEKAISTARQKNISISFDINYRTNLWSMLNARNTLEPLIKLASILFTTEEDLQRLFGFETEDPEKLASEARNMFGVDVLAITLREIISVNFNKWSGCAIGPDGFKRSSVYDVEIIDRVGAGDSFTAGFLSAWQPGSLSDAVEFGAAFSALKQTIHGDICTATVSDTQVLIDKGGPGRIQR